jgi:hypothetical protein
MSLSKDELRDAIKGALVEVAEEKRTFWVEPERHWRDHDEFARLACRKNQEEYEDDHRFVRGVRRGVDSTEKTAWKAIVGLGVIGLAAWIGNAVIRTVVEWAKKGIGA